eukprot:SAG11_NODE_3597_length_2347_cov_3.269573_5_plen_98_part_00
MKPRVGNGYGGCPHSIFRVYLAEYRYVWTYLVGTTLDVKSTSTLIIIAAGRPTAVVRGSLAARRRCEFNAERAPAADRRGTSCGTPLVAATGRRNTT